MNVKTYLLLMLILLLCSCRQETVRENKPIKEGTGLAQLGKTDIDNVLDVHIAQSQKLLRQLMFKLYKRNPRELKKSNYQLPQEQAVRLFDLEHDWHFPELSGKIDVEAIKLTFDERYEGDRVFALVAGLLSMVMKSYDYKSEFYMFDSIEPQALYNCSRNIEIAVWRLSNSYDDDGELFLYTNSLPGEQTNLSFERLFGKLIGTQDNIAYIIAGKKNRTIKGVIQRMATAVFLPI